MSKKLIIMATILAFCLISIFIYESTQQPKQKDLRETKSVFKTITYAEYNRIKTGMTLAEVESLIGSEGEELSSSAIGDITSKEIAWKNTLGSSAIVLFTNGKVFSKAQYGLK